MLLRPASISAIPVSTISAPGNLSYALFAIAVSVDACGYAAGDSLSGTSSAFPAGIPTKETTKATTITAAIP